MNTHHGLVDILVRRWLMNGSLVPTDVHELRERLAALQAIYRPHIAIEDHELFPSAGRLLSADQLRNIGREMAARRSVSAMTSHRSRRSDEKESLSGPGPKPASTGA